MSPLSDRRHWFPWLSVAIAVVLTASCRAAPSARPVESPAMTSPSPSSAVGLAIPFESEGACPFECCVYRTWSVDKATDVRTARDKGAPPAFRVQAGEKVEALTGMVVVSRAGQARAPRDVAIEGLGTLRKGDEVSVLHPVGEGYWLVWREGKKGSAQVGEKPARPARPGPWEPELYQTSKPEFRWWVQVRDGKGRVGWTDEPEHFGNKDRCG